MPSLIATSQFAPRSFEATGLDDTSAPHAASAASPAVRCRDVCKRFYYYEHRTASLREAFMRLLRRKPLVTTKPHFELTGFNLDVHPGEAVALIGSNGSGKSTLLRMIAGIYQPTTGSVETRGKVAAVIELGAGFHPELTGKENVELYGAVMGLTRRQVHDRFDDILAFADIGDFISMPVKYYSSGMHARLAFAVTVCVEPDILLLDEVLAVGDQDFREKCIDRLKTFQHQGGTLVVVSHDLDTVRSICTRGVWIEKGVVMASGPVEEVIGMYLGHSTGEN
jgi:ABC-type polysaccharide/polyol phosphate transport system ATPase subunit